MRAFAAALTAGASPWEEPITKAMSPRPAQRLALDQRCHSSLAICFALHAQGDKAGAFAHGGQDRLAFLFQRFFDLRRAGVFVRQRRFGQFDDSEAAESGRRFWYSATPAAKYGALSFPTQIRSIFCIPFPPRPQAKHKKEGVNAPSLVRSKYPYICQNSSHGLTSLRACAWICTSRPGWITGRQQHIVDGRQSQLRAVVGFGSNGRARTSGSRPGSGPRSPLRRRGCPGGRGRWRCGLLSNRGMGPPCRLNAS